MNVWRAWSVLLGVCLLLGCAPEAAPTSEGRKLADGITVHYRPWDKPALELDLVLQEKGGSQTTCFFWSTAKAACTV
jgi:hypothetical protein